MTSLSDLPGRPPRGAIPYECRTDAAAGSRGLVIDPGPVRSVADVMVTQPKTAPVTLSIAGARALLADSHVHMVLLVDGGRLVGTVVRGDLPPTAAPTDAALPYALLEGRLISPAADAELTRFAMSRHAVRRLAVVDDADRLLGLLCLKASHRGFCADSDVIARRDVPQPVGELVSRAGHWVGEPRGPSAECQPSAAPVTWGG